MRDYVETATKLREKASIVCNSYDVDPYNAEKTAMLMEEAADAIEELQGKLKELYELTCDVNANEIKSQIEWGNLDNFLRAFRKYADKIAGMPLPAPPKGVE